MEIDRKKFDTEFPRDLKEELESKDASYAQRITTHGRTTLGNFQTQNPNEYCKSKFDAFLECLTCNCKSKSSANRNMKNPVLSINKFLIYLLIQIGTICQIFFGYYLDCQMLITDGYYLQFNIFGLSLNLYLSSALLDPNSFKKKVTLKRAEIIGKFAESIAILFGSMMIQTFCIWTYKADQVFNNNWLGCIAVVLSLFYNNRKLASFTTNDFLTESKKIEKKNSHGCDVPEDQAILIDKFSSDAKAKKLISDSISQKTDEYLDQTLQYNSKFLSVYKLKQFFQFVISFCMVIITIFALTLIPKESYVNSIVSIVICSCNCIFGWVIFIHTLGIVMNECPYFQDVDDLKYQIQSIDGVIEVNECAISSETDRHFAANVSLIARNSDGVYKRVKDKINGLGLYNNAVQIETLVQKNRLGIYKKRSMVVDEYQKKGFNITPMNRVVEEDSYMDELDM